MHHIFLVDTRYTFDILHHMENGQLECRIISHDGLFGRCIQQFVKTKFGWIPCGPLADDIDELRVKLKAMLAACDEPVLQDGKDVRVA